MGDRDLRAFQVGETCQENSLESVVLELDNVFSRRTALMLLDIVEEGIRRCFSRRFRHACDMTYPWHLPRCSHFIARPLSRSPGLEGAAAN